jgi:hypothetical protein
VVRAVRATLRPLADTAAARKAGFVPLAIGRFRDGTPFQGIHWIHLRRFRNPGAGLTKPTFLLYAPVKGRLTLVGAAFSERIGHDENAPSDIGATQAEWHLHQACFGIPGIGFTLADGVDDCLEMDGTPGPRQTAMVHIWTGLESPDGPFSHDNVALPFAAVGLGVPTGPETTIRGLAVAIADSYGFRLPFVKRLDVVAADSPLQDSIAVERKAIEHLIPGLQAAEKRLDRAAYDYSAAQIQAHGQALRTLYDRLAPTPEYRRRLAAQFAMALGEVHHGH